MPEAPFLAKRRPGTLFGEPGGRPGGAMKPVGGPYVEMRDIWKDFNHRQEFEHELINRKTTWLLSTQAILFAAFGVTLREGEGPVLGITDDFRILLSIAGLSIAALTMVGVLCVIHSKRISWKTYAEFYASGAIPGTPAPFDRTDVQWGVRTRNTWLTLAPDGLLPVVFIVVWSILIAKICWAANIVSMLADACRVPEAWERGVDVLLRYSDRVTRLATNL
jgi:hypothetical protein